MTILIIEDEYKLSSILKKGLETEHYVVGVAHDGEEGLHKALKNEYDLIILDLMLPKMDGFSVCQELRRCQVNTPVLILTARDSVEDRVRGLDIGADDYLVKPFEFDELLARIRSLLRRQKTTKLPQLKVADLVLDPASHEVKRAGRLIRLTAKEYILLDYLMRYPNQVLTRSQLIEHVWGPEVGSEGNQLDIYIWYLRHKIDSEYQKKLIQTVRGTGYKIVE